MFTRPFSTGSTHSGHRGTEIPRCSGSDAQLAGSCTGADKWRDKVDVRRIQPLSRRDATAHAHVRLLRQSYAVRCAWLRGRCIGGICLVAGCRRGEFLAQSGRNHRGLKRGCCIVRVYHCRRVTSGGGVLYLLLFWSVLREPSTTYAALSALMRPTVPFFIALNSAMEVLFVPLVVFLNW